MKYPGISISMFVNKHTISYSDEGPENAPVIIFIHGFPFNKSMWRKQAEALKEHTRVITYDVRGHGDSDSGTLDFSIGLFVQDLLALLEKLKIDKAILCGLSMGGYIALNAVENHPERFRALVLCDSNCIGDTPETKGKRIKAIESIREKGVKKYVDESIENLLAAETFKTKPAVVDEIRTMMVNTAWQTLINTLQALTTRKETCGKLPEIRIPVLIIVGKEDIVTPPEAAKFIHEKIKGSMLSILPHAGHLSNLENPDQFNDILKKFIASVQ
jgi:3-oxoadipate enol-lactonase